jgi:hypothetical protein
LVTGVGAVAAGVVVAAGGSIAAGAVLGPLGAIASAVWAYRRLTRTQAELTDVVPLDRAAHAIRDAYLALGELSEEAAASLAIEPRASGYLRVWLRHASPEESERFSRALGEVLQPEGFPRYVVSRLVPGHRPALALLARAATFRPPFEHRWEPVPSDLGTHKNRAEAYGAAWRRWLGPSELLFTQRAEEGRQALAAAGAQAAQWDVRQRQIWL